MNHIKILRPGLMTTIQDSGRPSLGRFGVSVSGPMDPFAFQIANRLAGNPDHFAGLEITTAGASLQFTVRAVFALAGAHLAPVLAGELIETWRSYEAHPGDVLTFDARIQGSRAYLAISGGVHVPPMLGSVATDVTSGIGGIDGKPLVAGQAIPCGLSSAFHSRVASFEARAVYQDPFDLRIIPSAEESLQDAIRRLTASGFTVTPRSSRMGYQLEGPALRPRGTLSMVSEPIAPGTLQAPSDTPPILLMADRQTLGGYPCVGHVIAADLPKAGQLWIGQLVRFHPVTLDQARSLLRERKKVLDRAVLD